MEWTEEVRGCGIIWAAFQDDIQRIEEALVRAYGADKVSMYHGQISQDVCDVNKRRFQDGSSNWFVGSLSKGARGLTLATQPNAQVVAPTSGRIVFADYYRGFGQILIIDHGQGWASLITSLHRLSVGVGDSVRSGTPVGIAAPTAATVTVELRRNGQPVDIVPLLAR